MVPERREVGSLRIKEDTYPLTSLSRSIHVRFQSTPEFFEPLLSTPNTKEHYIQVTTTADESRTKPRLIQEGGGRE